MKNTMTADAVAALFAQRLSPAGGWISRKQADWLFGVFTRENGLRSEPSSACGFLADGREWSIRRLGNANGACSLSLTSVEAQAAAVATAGYEERCRVFNEEAMRLMQAGDLAGLQAHMANAPRP